MKQRLTDLQCATEKKEETRSKRWSVGDETLDKIKHRKVERERRRRRFEGWEK